MGSYLSIKHINIYPSLQHFYITWEIIHRLMKNNNYNMQWYEKQMIQNYMFNIQVFYTFIYLFIFPYYTIPWHCLHFCTCNCTGNLYMDVCNTLYFCIDLYMDVCNTLSESKGKTYWMRSKDLEPVFLWCQLLVRIFVTISLPLFLDIILQ